MVRHPGTTDDDAEGGSGGGSAIDSDSA